jgi:hypothetical protein
MGKLTMVRRLVSISALLLLSTLGLNAASWYVDSSATGVNNGTSWGNAWSSFAAINWAAVNPGDFVYISGGASGGQKVYNQTLTIGKAGSPGNLITVGVKADDAAHNGTIIIGGGNYIEMSGVWYIKLNGYVAGAQRFLIRDTFNTSTAEFANAIMAPQTAGTVIDSLSISNCNNGINVNDSANFTIKRTLMRQMRGDAMVRSSGSFGTMGLWDSNLIEDNDWEVASGTVPGPTQGMGPDGIQAGHNVTIRNNTFRVKQYNIVTSVQHTDMIQAAGTYLNIYGNDFINVGDSCIQLHGWFGQAQKREHIHIFNNTFRIVDEIDPFPQYIRLYNVAVPITNVNDLVIANNNFIDNRWQNIETLLRDMGGAPTGSGNYLVNNNFIIGTGATGTLFWNLDLTSMPGAWTINGNAYYAGGNVVNMNGSQMTASTWVSGNEPLGRIGMPTFTSYTYQSLNNNYRLAGGDTIARDTGVNLSGFFTTDADGNTRTPPWDKGPYEYGGAPVVAPGTLVLASASYSVAENGGSIVLSVQRTGGSSGAVGCSYATANGTASSGVNYTGASSTLSWGDGDAATKTVSITVTDVDMTGNKDFTFTISSGTGGATIGSPAVATVTITGTGVSGPALLSGWTWPATNGVILAPYTSNLGYVVQSGENDDPALGGSARFTFTNYAGVFKVKVSTDAPNTGANSAFVNIETEPTTPDMIWDVVTLTSGFEDRYVSWRGPTGSPTEPDVSLKTWTLAGGTNTLIIRGREANMKLATITLEPVLPEGLVVSVSGVDCNVTNPPTEGGSGTFHFKAGVTIPVLVTFTDTVTVTGTPTISLNTGGTATYVSGSGTTNLTFNYVVLAGQNVADLDYTGTSSLALSGGTIKNGTDDATLTLADPGEPGSIGYAKNIVIDTTAPTVTISGPNDATVSGGGEVTWTLTYADDHFLNSDGLDSGDVTLTLTGTATGAVEILTGNGMVRTVRVSGLDGNGTIRISLGAGTCTDEAGNTAPSAGPSSITTVSTYVPVAPTQPSNVSPASGATGVSRTPTLIISGYSDPGSLAHAATEWIVKQGLATTWTDPLGPTTSTVVPLNLSYSTTYTYQARVKNSANLWSDWSTPTSFTVMSAPSAPVENPGEVTIQFRGTIIIGR